MMDPLNLKIISWNSRGFNEYKSDFLTEYICDNTIICNQENFILQQNVYKIVNNFITHFLAMPQYIERL